MLRSWRWRPTLEQEAARQGDSHEARRAASAGTDPTPELEAAQKGDGPEDASRGLSKPRPRPWRSWWVRALAVKLLACACVGSVFPDHLSLAGVVRLRGSVNDVRYAWPPGTRNISVAVVGGGIAGLGAGYTFLESNRRSLRHGVGIIADVEIFEASARVGGHSWTFPFPLSNGSTFPVDLAYAYNPTMAAYGPLRRFERKHGIALHKLTQRISVLRDMDPIGAADAARFDNECDRWMEIIRWTQANMGRARLWYGTRSLRRMLADNGFSMGFFTFRLYPVVRFVIVSGSKGKLLDSSAIGAMASYYTGWASCYANSLHGNFDWYSVAGGSDKHIEVFRSMLGDRLKTGSPVKSVRTNGRRGGFDVTIGSYPQRVQTRHFDAVVMAVPPDDAYRILGGAEGAWSVWPFKQLARLWTGALAPGWLDLPTTEETEVVLHSDESVLIGDESGAVLNYRLNATSDPSGAALSVLWAEMHGARVAPRPILSTGDLRLYGPKGAAGFAGEVARVTFKHIHLPTLFTFLRVSQGRLVSSFWRPLEFAGAWVGFGMSHPDALVSGVRAAERLGAAVSWSSFFLYGDKYAERDGFEQRLRHDGGGVP